MSLSIKSKYLTINCCTTIDGVEVPVWPMQEEVPGSKGTIGVGLYIFLRSGEKSGSAVIKTHKLQTGALIVQQGKHFYYSPGLSTNTDELLQYMASQVDMLWEIKDTQKIPKRIDGSEFEPNSMKAHLDNWLWVTNYSMHVDVGVKFANNNDVDRFLTLFAVPDFLGVTAKAAVVYAARLNGLKATDDALIALRRKQYYASNGWDFTAKETYSLEQLQQIITHVDVLRIHNPEPDEGEELWKLLVADISEEELADTNGVVVPESLHRVFRDSSKEIANTWRAIDKSDLDDFSVRALTQASGKALLDELMARAERLDGHGGRAKVVKFLTDIYEEAIPSEDDEEAAPDDDEDDDDE